MNETFLSEPSPSSPPQPEKPTVLVVEDIGSTREFVGLILQTSGYKVLYAEDGANAMETIIQKRPDVILLDILLPKVDGYTICSQVKNHPALKNHKVIIFSALNSQTDRYKAEEAGADAFLEKPIDTTKLLATFKRVLP